MPAHRADKHTNPHLPQRAGVDTLCLSFACRDSQPAWLLSFFLHRHQKLVQDRIPVKLAQCTISQDLTYKA